ncbi:Fe2+-dependent dioxygenase [Paraburkholderia sp. Ac-20336]|uniref:Fe2+-dependent dioxygenase n=1 Tax=Burkholderiaceae TaxID=119060 RepID=UPI00141D975F|nr:MULTISPECIES: Fe2+-dependent dioxygenase [Burkholderiaceae]MBN3803116.1 Fe2+-dependent dioxygenase [Paraburkholderia sp. Ac-20336]MBN3846910.1 Fe2+-dependent dioxygenase [Paraburkholderia sp. Ac-20342]NIF53833.1 Fe2+-dependent dioxygenase [Burkholderia sp. Ax-1724]NIF77643.1 Fe2+-dependent dioxygenase [Paraburkholderia sp. Cy-641]
MLIRIPSLLDADTVRYIRGALEAPDSPWVDGRATAGYHGAEVKQNQQLDEEAPITRELADRVLAATERHPFFISAALPNRAYVPHFNRYSGGMTFGSHIDGAVRVLRSGLKVRTDVSITVFLSEPHEYDGGELRIEDTYGAHEVKLPAGDAILYPATSMHHVVPVTRGVRLASFFWVQSLVRDDNQRALLFELDNTIQRLNATNADNASRRSLVGIYHNLLRVWSET